MRLFNTLSQQVEPLRPLGDAVRLYVCGITPYDTTHLGHAFLNVTYDTLVRYLRSQGTPVNYVQNVTDIDDDILRKAREVGVPWDELGRRETDRYLEDLRDLNVELPTHYVHATNEIPGMIEFIRILLERGYAYENDGWVYYSVASDPDYGALAAAVGLTGYETLLAVANERGNFPNDPHKRDPLDFVLWQHQQPGEPAWPSPWGPGRPGWHIECSAMANHYLGPRIDIHGGGTDLIFPHHTCEIAQSEHATGERPFVQIWMHCAMVAYQGEKMSKSLGNLVLVRDLLQTYSADAVRVMLLSHHYHKPWEYTEDDMNRCAELAGSFSAAASLLSGANNLQASAVVDDEGANKARQRFFAALENDLDTPAALDVLADLARTASSEDDLTHASTLIELAAVLGLRLTESAVPHVTSSAQASTGSSTPLA